jgi:hypothetical protein
MSCITYTDIGKFLNPTINSAGQDLLAAVIPGVEKSFSRECISFMGRHRPID